MNEKIEKKKIFVINKVVAFRDKQLNKINSNIVIHAHLIILR